MIWGWARPKAQFVRLTRKIAFQPLAWLGVWTRETATPLCGLLTLNVKPLIAVAPAGSCPEMFTVVSRVAVPEQVLLKVDAVHAPGAPEYRAARACTSAAVTEMPLIVVGACVPHAQVAGQFVVPVAAQFPDS